MATLAAVFVRRSGAHGAGHVGWCFAYGDDAFNAGSVENPQGTLFASPEDAGFWAVRIRDPLSPMRLRGYDEFKTFKLKQGRPFDALRIVLWVRRQGYDVFGRNCMDATYDILRTFGVQDLPVPARYWEPNHSV